MKRKNRINLLPDIKINELYNIPNFTDQEMEIFFSLSVDDHLLLNQYKTIKLKIYFIIQLGYFRATQQFYDFNLEDIHREVLYVTNLYFDLPLKNITSKPYRTIIKSQQAVILNFYEYQDWSPKFAPQIEVHLSELIKYYPKPEVATLELFKYFEQIKIVIPSYRVLQDIYSKILSEHEEKLNNLILDIPEDIQNQLSKIIDKHYRDIDADPDCQSHSKCKNEPEDDDNDIIMDLGNIRYDQKDFKYTALRLEIKKIQKIKSLYEFGKLFLPTLNISKNSITYYADLTNNYSTSRLKKLIKPQQFLYVLCFIHHRYQQFMDNLIITFMYHVNLLLEKAKVYAKDECLKYSATLVLEFPKLAKFLNWFPQEEDKQNLDYIQLSQEAYKILPKEQFSSMANFIEGKIFDKTKAQWQCYEESSSALARYLRPIMLHVDFILINHNSNLLELIGLLKTHYAKNKNPGSLKIPSNSSLIKDKNIIEYLKNTDNPDYLDPYRLEFYVYHKMYHHVDKGRLCCNDSISYKDFDLDLIPEEDIEKSLEIAEKFGYYKIRNYCDQILDDALDELDQALIRTNNNIDSGVNKHINIVKNQNEDGSESISWTLIYEAKESISDGFFANLPKIEIADLLKFIGDKINLWESFNHIKPKYIKRQKPDITALRACLLSEAFGISLGYMAEISDLNLNLLKSTKTDFIRFETLTNTNDICSNYLNKLAIFKAWDLLDGKILADADGKKHKATTTTIQSRFSTKYIGKGTGISICSLVANHGVANAKTIGLNEYEGHGLYDLTLGNKSDIKIDYVTGDNHSINPVNFVGLDSIDVGYLPSIKDIREAAKDIYSSRAASNYNGLIKPKAQINKELIRKNKAWIIRVLLSLLLQENTQTILMRKLSTHARYARLNASLYEYNKIFKSNHVLNLIDNIKLRQAIRSARNRTESYHALQGTIRQIYHGIFKGKRIVDNNVSAHAVRLLSNKIISYNATILNIIYQKLIAEGSPKSEIDNFIRISPVAWEHISFTGRYNFTKDNSIVNLEKIVRLLEEKLRKDSKQKL
jgi:hypothetical protein